MGRTPLIGKDAATASAIRLPVSLSASLIAASLALSLAAGGLARYFMARRMAKMKPGDSCDDSATGCLSRRPRRAAKSGPV
jgi:hypothetical protein